MATTATQPSPGSPLLIDHRTNVIWPRRIDQGDERKPSCETDTRADIWRKTRVNGDGFHEEECSYAWLVWLVLMSNSKKWKWLECWKQEYKIWMEKCIGAWLCRTVYWFYPKSSRKLWKHFKQGNDMINFVFQKDSCNGWERIRESKGGCLDRLDKKYNSQEMKVIWTREMVVEKIEWNKKEIGGVKLTRTWR